jgi:hypothetical protein
MMMPADEAPQYLFTVRIWPTDLGEGRVEWRGRVQLLPQGEVRYFRDWDALVELIRAQCRIANVEGGNAEEGSRIP